MDIGQLQAVEAVIAAGSFTAAARRQHLTQPALWARVRGLEEELGIRFFERRGRGVVPTAACVQLRPQLRALLDQVGNVAAAAEDVREGRGMPARIGCAQYHVPHFLAGCIEELLTKHPRAPFPRIVPVTSATAAASLKNDEVDLLVSARQAESAWEGFVLYPLFIAVVGRGVPKGPFDIRNLRGRRIVTLPRDSAVRTVLEDAAAFPLDIVHEDRDTSTLLSLAERGLATAVIVSEALLAEQVARAGRLAVGRRVISTELWLQWRSEEALSPSARVLRDVIRGRVGRRRVQP